MKYTLKSSCLPCTPDEFADKNGLEMQVTERMLDKWQIERGNTRYYAHFRDTEVQYGALLRSEYGDGHTPEEAIEDYLHKIKGCCLVVDAHKNSRRSFSAPNEWKEG